MLFVVVAVFGRRVFILKKDQTKPTKRNYGAIGLAKQVFFPALAIQRYNDVN